MAQTTTKPKNDTPKTTDELMVYLRDEKHIAISGQEQKYQLMNIGFYHGYKGFRSISRYGTKEERLAYRTFDQLMAVYQFDAQLKALFYPCVMQIETALKNYVLEVIVEQIHSESFIDVYGKLLTNYRSQPRSKHKMELKRRLALRNQIYRVQADAFSGNRKMAAHYLKDDVNLPVWAIFELMSFGQLGHFILCLNPECRRSLSEKLGIRQSDDTDAMLLGQLVFAAKDLRNAIAHNNVIFDTRFRTGSIQGRVAHAISNATQIQDINFQYITDYLVLIIYLMKGLHISREEMERVVDDYEAARERLYKAVPYQIFSRIIYSKDRGKIETLRRFIRENN